MGGCQRRSGLTEGMRAEARGRGGQGRVTAEGLGPHKVWLEDANL